MIEHTKLFMELLGDIKNFALMKKHYKAYVNGFDDAKDLRIKLMEAETAEEVETLVKASGLLTEK
jgi:tRNA-dihydrouridine synthase